VLHLISRPVLHYVNRATAFQDARFLPFMFAANAWITLRKLWINIYQNSPSIIIHDAGTNFAFKKFRNEARALYISFKQIPTKAH
jgi:hypothetical protein